MNRRFLLVAILLAGLSAALVYARVSSDSGSGGTSRPAAGEQQVVVAKTEIKQRTLITADMLEVKAVAVNNVATGAFADIEDVVGTVTKFPISINQQITSSYVVDTSNPTASAALNQVVPTNMRAISITASQVGNAGGLILPGDWVDIIWNFPDDTPVYSKTILRNVQVVSVAQNIVNSGPIAQQTPAVDGEQVAPVAGEPEVADPAASTVTLLLTPEQAQQVFLAEERGRLRLDLRGFGDAGDVDPGELLITDLAPEAAFAGLPESLRPYGN
jgi:pilus assembly protein CpaB